ncbi:amidase [Xanthobacter pseudotagetidis]|uniref:amidase n=1 Tax=Xanthobacter pseudotagetidis TaxID=3119911 RepID=UPI00372779B7
MTETFAPLGVLETVRAVAAGTLDPRSSVAAAAARARACEPAVGAFTHLAALDAAADPGAGPLAGIAVAVKDLIDTAGMPTTYGSAIFADHVPAEDAAVVKRLKALSAVLVGKTVTTEFAWRHPAGTRNPWNVGHTPGGSSSGSAAAVASGAAHVALGTQTLGSVLRPAAYCGVVGLKASFGAVPRAGVHPLSQSLDHVGLFARTVDDAALVLSLIAEGDGGLAFPPFGVPPEGLAPFPKPRIGLLAGPEWELLEAPQREVLRQAAGVFAAAGALVEEIALPPAFQRLGEISATLCSAEGAYNLGPLTDRFPDKASERVKALVEAGRAVPATAYVAACHDRLALRATLPAALAGFDVLLTAPAFGEAPEGLGNTGDPALCVPWTTLGVPAVALPAGTGPKGLPLGIQLVAPFGEDLKLLRIAKACELALGRPVAVAPAA